LVERDLVEAAREDPECSGQGLAEPSVEAVLLKGERAVLYLVEERQAEHVALLALFEELELLVSAVLVGHVAYRCVLD